MTFAIQEVDRLAEKDRPDLDYTVESIAVTNHEWYRQGQIFVPSVLRRDDETYKRVEDLYEDLNNTASDTED